MTRYVIIALMNLLVVGSIAASALFALFRGCNMDGTCSEQSSMLTWVLGVGLSIAVVAAGLFIGRIVLRRRHVANQDIAIVALPRTAATDDAAEEDGDEAMLSRLARMTRTVAVDPVVTEPNQDEFDADDADLDEATAFDEAFETADEFIDDLWPKSDFIDDDVGDASDAWSVSETPAPNLHVVVRNGERATPRPFSFEFDSEDAADDEHRFAWLFDDTAGVNSAHVRRDLGFPWSIAGIDHVCRGVSRFGLMVAGTDIASEASAWCQVTASLPRGEALADEDATAFTDWLNTSLRLIGRSGEAMVEEAMEALEAEAVSDPAVARCLPDDFWTDDHPDDSRIARFG